jgi:hypothetical protein
MRTAAYATYDRRTPSCAWKDGFDGSVRTITIAAKATPNRASPSK